MVPDARTVLRWRFGVLVALRSLAVLIAVMGVVVCGTHLVPMTERIIGFEYWSYYAAVVATLATFGAGALGLALGSRRLSAWIVPAPRPGCPACGYAVATVERGTCPECGVRFADGGSAGDGAKDVRP